MIARNGDARRMDLRETGISEECTFLVGAPDRGRVATLGVRGEIKDIAVSAGAEEHRMCGVGGDSAGDHVAHDNPAGNAIDNNEIEHLGAREHLHLAKSDLSRECAVCAEEKLLSRLSTRVKRSRDL